ncbi:MAG: electron transfer flavoprotein subunit alpha/FixB family protein [Lentisphaerae bacterium]|nr:electron transfer flavoprotein subunit alpha/FixB family protein [Lentisphaerota bacterium]MBT4819437.1 electron transfer flavoprotein subunit alpha/FixB family protein [Lentisphaerota bacterium]MBT5608429.1 electron transfer flavoprotein subunit alpha/FixB family protein [Lentisphaerota bacterium]MBT7055047.1 electron transfer flavoprotein subunit alpha/FixB family protein [Lentisphaerota bacterium]MBT7847767.1 electron transfer flavoprotein subunit alpha/FixB family protein [Lentisphaerota
MGNVWVFIEQDDGKIADVSLELVSKARELAAELGVRTEGVFLGSDVAGLVPSLHEYGCDNVFLAQDPGLALFSALPYTKVIVDLVKARRPNIMMFGATPLGRSLAPRIASKLLAGLTADCTDLQIDDFEDRANKRVLKQKLMQIRPAFGGNIIATIVNSWEDPQMVTVREGVMRLDEPTPGRTGEVTEVAVELSDEDTIVSIIERFRAESSVNLKAAQIIVAGGYGVGSKENFDLVLEFAETIGAGVGASRAAVDAGWVDHDHQVGQTGVTVRPRLYIACGISGSVQHRAGMSDSAKIVAINSDANSPIFAIADYGIVGDLHDVIPKFIKAYRARV